MTVLSFAALLASLCIVAAPFAGAVDSAAPTSTVRIPLTTVAGQDPLTLEATLHKPAGNGPFPVVLYSHGAAGDPRLYKVTVKVQDFADALASRGVAVLAVMRVGRGASDGVYEEEPSACTVDAARAGIASASRSVDASIAWLRTQTWVKTDQIVLAGHSRGGILSTVYAAEHPGLVKGVINFSGG